MKIIPQMTNLTISATVSAKIYTIFGFVIMFDRELAELYEEMTVERGNNE